MLTYNQHHLSTYGHLLVGRDSFLSPCTRTWRGGACKHIPREVALRRFAHSSLSSRKCEKATRAPGQPPIISGVPQTLEPTHTPLIS